MFDITMLRDELRSHLGVDIDDLPTPQADLLINRSYKWLLDTFKFRVEEKSVIFPTLSGERNYDLPDDLESLRGISIEDLTSKRHTPLDRMTVDVYEQEYINDVESNLKPTNYVREGSCLKLWPTPDAVYNMTLKYARIITNLSDTNTSPEVPEAWEEWILMGAVYRGHFKYGDIPRASALKSWIKDETGFALKRKETESREEEDSHRAGVEVYIPPYET